MTSEINGRPKHTTDVPAEDHSEDAARRASELAHRALQDAVIALDRAPATRLTPTELDELEQAVVRARQLVATAQTVARIAHAHREISEGQRVRARAMREQARTQGERAQRGFMALVTWGRRHVQCGACGQQFVVAFRCSTHEPQTVTTVHCARPGCAASVDCQVPTSAYAFTIRPTGKR